MEHQDVLYMTTTNLTGSAFLTQPIPQSGRISTTPDWLSTTQHTAAAFQHATIGGEDMRIILLSIIGSLFIVAVMGIAAILCLQCHKKRRVGLKICQPKHPNAVEVGTLSPPSGSRSTDTRGTPSTQHSQDSLGTYSPGSPSVESQRHSNSCSRDGSGDTQHTRTGADSAPVAPYRDQYAPYAAAQYEHGLNRPVLVNRNMLRNESVMKRVMARDILDELQFDDEVFGSPSEGRCTVTELEGSRDTRTVFQRPHIVDESTLEIVVMGDDDAELTPDPEAEMQRSPRFAVV